MTPIPLASDKFLDAIRNRHSRFAARFAKRDTVDGSAPDWSDFPIQVVELWIQLTTQVHGSRPPGYILSVMPEQVHDHAGTDIGSWAEYSETHYCGNGEWLAEEYRMQLLEVIE